MGQPLRVVVYSDSSAVRGRVMGAMGRRPHTGLGELVFVEVATYAALIAELNGGGVDLAVLDGEATPAGGLGVARQCKDELAACPLLVVLTARDADSWLGAWSKADVVLGPGVTPAQTADAVLALLVDGTRFRTASDHS